MPHRASKSTRRAAFGGAGLALASLFGPLGCPAAERAALPDVAPPTRATPPPPPDPCQMRPRELAERRPASLDSAAAWTAFERARRHAEASAWAKAEAGYREAVRLDPRLGLAQLGLAEVLAHTGGPAETRREHLAAALVDLPRNPRAHVRFASALEATGDRRGALVHLRCALELKDSLREARRRAAHLALELEGSADAGRLMAPLLTAAPQAPDWILASTVRAKAGDDEGAAEAMNTAARMARSAPLYRRAAALWHIARNPDRAEQAKLRADAIDPPPEPRALRPLRAR